MKRQWLAIVLIVAVVFVSAGQSEAGRRYKSHRGISGMGFLPEDVSLDFDDGALTYYSDEYDETVEINEDGEIYVNNRRVKTDKHQEKLAEKYYEQMEDIIELAKEIGIEGAKLGVGGAKIGVKAVMSAVMLVLEDYDSYDLEEDLEKEAEKLERKAKKLEKKAEKIEDMADDFGRTHRKLRKAVPQLNELEWF